MKAWLKSCENTTRNLMQILDLSWASKSMAAVACCEVMLKPCKGVSIILHRESSECSRFQEAKTVKVIKRCRLHGLGKRTQGTLHNPALHARAAVGYPTKADNRIGSNVMHCANDCFCRAQGGRNHPWYCTCRAVPDACFYASTGRLESSSLVLYLSCSICRVAIIC